MKKLLSIVTLILVALAAMLVWQTFRFKSRQVNVKQVNDGVVNMKAAPERLARAINFQTISYEDASRTRFEAFEGFRRYLEEAFPRVHQTMMREQVNGHSLLYRWQGSDSTLKPIVLAAHQDVVPVEPGTEGNWTYPPFEGRIADGFVWGRGAIDDKMGLLGLLEAAEMLIGEGFQPRRTIYLAFGHDEETGGLEGAAKIADLLESRNVEAEYVLDEGGAVTEGYRQLNDAEVLWICTCCIIRTFARTSITSSHGEMKAGFIKEHQTLACHPSNLLAKQLARRFVSLCRHQTLFLRDRPKRCKARQTVAR